MVFVAGFGLPVVGVRDDGDEPLTEMWHGLAQVSGHLLCQNPAGHAPQSSREVLTHRE